MAFEICLCTGEPLPVVLVDVHVIVFTDAYAAVFTVAYAAVLLTLLVTATTCYPLPHGTWGYLYCSCDCFDAGGAAVNSSTGVRVL